MSRLLTKNEANKSLRVTPVNHRAIKQIALDENANIIEITDKVVAEGIKAIQSRKPIRTTSAN